MPVNCVVRIVSVHYLIRVLVTYATLMIHTEGQNAPHVKELVLFVDNICLILVFNMVIVKN